MIKQERHVVGADLQYDLAARAAGLPVLGYRNNGLSDFITDGSDGVLVADAPEMAEALSYLIEHPDDLQRLRKTTTNVPPPIRPSQAMAAVDALYRRAALLLRDQS